MFTTIVAYAAFIFLSILFAYLIYDGVRLKTRAERDMEKLRQVVNGYRTHISWTKVSVLVAIWFASGWYLFG